MNEERKVTRIYTPMYTPTPTSTTFHPKTSLPTHPMVFLLLWILLLGPLPAIVSMPSQYIWDVNHENFRRYYRLPHKYRKQYKYHQFFQWFVPIYICCWRSLALFPTTLKIENVVHPTIHRDLF